MHCTLIVLLRLQLEGVCPIELVAPESFLLTLEAITRATMAADSDKATAGLGISRRSYEHCSVKWWVGLWEANARFEQTLFW